MPEISNSKPVATCGEYGASIYHYLMGEMETSEEKLPKESALPMGTYRWENDKTRLVNLLTALAKESTL